MALYLRMGLKYASHWGVREATKAAIILNYADINNKTFLNHFKGLTLNKNKYGWFEEFWQQQFNCTVKKNGKSTKKECTGDENLGESDFYADHAASQAVIDAVNAFVFAIQCHATPYDENTWIKMIIEATLKKPETARTHKIPYVLMQITIIRETFQF